jgi:hypothetical protein
LIKINIYDNQYIYFGYIDGNLSTPKVELGLVIGWMLSQLRNRRSPLIKHTQNPAIAWVLNNRRSLLLEDADYDGRSLSMLQKIAGALNQKVEIKFSAIAP